jgi:DNA-binding PadR family transcriptional regulator
VEVAHADDTRRRYYKLSEAGAKALEAELQYYENAVALARKRQALNHFYPYGQGA